MITSSTPYGKIEIGLNPLRLYLTLGVSFIASALSSKIKNLADLIYQGMEHPGFAIVHVQSPCTVYNDTFEVLKGNKKKGIAPIAWDIPDDHDVTDWKAGVNLLDNGGIPIGLLYSSKERVTFHDKIQSEKLPVRDVEQLFNTYKV
jgi:2-oxoglutarate ferredoxin oxidoreductase subunit beta